MCCVCVNLNKRTVTSIDKSWITYAISLPYRCYCVLESVFVVHPFFLFFFVFCFYFVSILSTEIQFYHFHFALTRLWHFIIRQKSKHHLTHYTLKPFGLIFLLFVHASLDLKLKMSNVKRRRKKYILTRMHNSVFLQSLYVLYMCYEWLLLWANSFPPFFSSFYPSQWHGEKDMHFVYI